MSDSELPVIGRREGEQQALEPIVVPVAAYTLDGEEVIERFAFRPVIPAGAAMQAARQITPDGILSVGPVLDFLQKSLMVDDRERFLEFFDRDDLMIPAELISEIYQLVIEEWTARPTRPRSASASGGRRARRTSADGARARASASKQSRS